MTQTSLLTRFLGYYYRSELRGSYFLTDILSQRLKSLQSLPIEVESGTLYADLRISSARNLLVEPKSLTGESLVMRHVVRSGDVVFDIGAHFGFYTVPLSEIVGDTGKVYAFEPNPELFSSLRQTIAERRNVELLPFALWHRRAHLELFVPEDASMASLSDWTDGTAGNIHRIECEAYSIDDLIEEGRVKEPSFIKCDVEGAEFSVFRGALKNLNRVDAPVILFEVVKLAAKSFGMTIGEYFDILETLEKPGYVFFEVTPYGIRRLASREIKYANVLAVPGSKLSWCSDILA